MSAISGHEIARQSIDVLEKMRSDNVADMFLTYVKYEAAEYNNFAEPKLPRRKNAPNYRSMDYIDGVTSSKAFYHQNESEYFRQIYFECLDRILSAMRKDNSMSRDSC